MISTDLLMMQAAEFRVARHRVHTAAVQAARNYREQPPFRPSGQQRRWHRHFEWRGSCRYWYFPAPNRGVALNLGSQSQINPSLEPA